ncbi:hypothetical protein [Aurantimonas sp. VKM B-3413]|uniref:hypothetical protein n=1 Tax=Aurantimonas sp. VKM B-3413 TaxID=2779401 RepID=UPI001E3ACBD8|nr:hypothetical protein [Aurantimonas sp. VKM B-3413]MCB8837026.1 hypothetical protein [Aurantimonas sp. VKM B-3413]
MVQPGFLSSADVQAWLNGVHPAWTALDFESFCRLHSDPDDPAFPISMSTSNSSPMATNAMLFLSRLVDGAKLTATGNLTRAFVAEAIETLSWPAFDPEEAFWLHKVINERDFLPLHAMRVFCDRAKLIRVYKGQLRLTKAGKQIVAAQDFGRLHGELFRAAFWKTNLAYFDGHPLAPWPQGDVGLVLWCLSVSAHRWQSPHMLVRSCTVPINGILEDQYRGELGGYILEHRILRPVSWFGLLDVETLPHPEFKTIKLRRYRKAPTFDQFLSFTVCLEPHEGGIQ